MANSSFDNKFKEFLLDFIIELNSSYGFKISIDKILKLFQIYGDFDFFDEEEAKNVLKGIFCQSKTQFEYFDKIFNSYFKNLKNKTGYEMEKRAITNVINDLNDQLDEIKKSADEDKERLYEELFTESFSSNEYILQIRKIIENITIVTSPEILWGIINQEADIISKYCEDVKYDEEKQKVIIGVEDDLERILFYNIENNGSQELSEFILSLAEMLKYTINQYDCLKKKELQEINTIMKDIEKLSSKQHRTVYTEGKNAVKSEMGYLYKDFREINEKDLDIINRYIVQNANKFKTRISKNLKSHGRRIFDYKRVMKNSIKTDMVPMELFFKKPHRTKVKIICIVDISGSCKRASQILLSFVYALQEIFTGGVESFVFVKNLEEATDVFKNYSLKEANERTSVLVERTYSNYYDSFKDFDSKYFERVTKDTIIIYLGDARNNNNKLGLEFLQRIRKKISSGKGKMYWLNTDEPKRWNVGDSVINQYSKYMDAVFPIINTKDLIKFLEHIQI